MKTANVTIDGHVMTGTRHYDAPRERVWQAWTDPDHITNWWGPHGFSTTTHAMDMRPGGDWRFTMHGPDGTDYPNLVTYEEVQPPERLAYAHRGTDGESPVAFRVVVTFDEENGGTRLTMRMELASPEECERLCRERGALEGLENTLDRLAAALDA